MSVSVVLNLCQFRRFTLLAVTKWFIKTKIAAKNAEKSILFYVGHIKTNQC